tara:strand:+ start:238 stop:738 length:501 start_codon:yes stop_codon:yes gene_type:complete
MLILSNKVNDEDLIKVLKIYNFYISNSYSNFEEKRFSKKSFKLLFKKLKAEKMPFIIANENQETVGFAFVNKFREKSGYRFTFEHSIYVNPKFINKGFGSIILKELIKECKKDKRIKNLIAVIGDSKNIASIKIHKNNGFKYIGTLHKVGYKKEKWVDSVYMQKRL